MAKHRKNIVHYAKRTCAPRGSLREKDMAKHRKTKKKTTASNGSRKERITITIDKDLLEWIDKRIEEKIFANRSHAIEFITTQAQK